MTNYESPVGAMHAEAGASLPKAFIDYANVEPEFVHAYREWRASCLDSGTISRGTKLLMVVALLVAQRDAGPLRVYASIARNEGATATELKEALRVGILFSGGAGIEVAASVADLLVD